MSLTPNEIKEKVQRHRKVEPYTHDFKVEALLKLRDNNMDMKLTASQVGCTYQDIRNWKHALGAAVYKVDDKLVHTNIREINTLVTRTRQQLIATNNDILEEAVQAQQEIIAQIRAVVPKTNNLFALSQALKILQEITTHKLAIGDDGQVQVSQTNTFTQLIERQVLNLQRDTEWKLKTLEEQQSMPPQPLKD